MVYGEQIKKFKPEKSRLINKKANYYDLKQTSDQWKNVEWNETKDV